MSTHNIYFCGKIRKNTKISLLPGALHVYWAPFCMTRGTFFTCFITDNLTFLPFPLFKAVNEFIYFTCHLKVWFFFCIWAATSENVPWHARTTKILIRLRVRAVWSESPLSASRNFVPLGIQNAASEDSVQTARMRWLTRIFAGRTFPMVRFQTFRLICCK